VVTINALTLNQIKEKFLAYPSQSRSSQDGRVRFNCSLTDCVAKGDEVSKETEINYTIMRRRPVLRIFEKERVGK
jgi:predicted deacylase